MQRIKDFLARREQRALLRNFRNLRDLGEALREMKALRAKVRDGNITRLSLGICANLDSFSRESLVSILSITWRYRRDNDLHVFPIAHLEDSEKNKWEGSNWFYRVHLLNHVITELEAYLHSKNRKAIYSLWQ